MSGPSLLANIRPWTNFSKQDKTWAEFSFFRSGHLHADAFLVLSVKLPNLQLKTCPKQLLGSLPLVIALPIKLNRKHFSRTNNPAYFSSIFDKEKKKTACHVLFVFR